MELLFILEKKLEFQAELLENLGPIFTEIVQNVIKVWNLAQSFTVTYWFRKEWGTRASGTFLAAIFYFRMAAINV